ncbi:hybrid PKS-NRPS PsoA [Xylariaceae sp. FL1651]|nr:hybrid PKS-NRPS PsoA [Xylariaceae sp. FL1651]
MNQRTWKTEPIAIVGSSCRFPGDANTPSKLWELLREPRDLRSEITSSRFNPNGFYHKNGEHHGSMNVRYSYLLEEDFRVFDHSFFGIHPREAESMDPQQRILLETVYEGLESAGYSMHDLGGSSTAVYVGQMTNDYYDLLLRDLDNAPQYAATGTSRAMMANRISHFFDWKGPSAVIDTACSSSLVALHQAVQSLRSGESDMAVVAGVNLILGPEMFLSESNLHMLSPNGRSRMWDSSADGYARGEGFAVICLKTLKQAIFDKDHIECIIRETGVNQDGNTPGITVPSVTSQASLIQATYRKCGLDFNKADERCQYFEAHGTGTLAGDPKEAEAISKAFFSNNHNESAGNNQALYVGSIKTVIGHLEGAAGLAGVLKASLAVQHGEIPPNMHFNKLNPSIKPFYQHLRVPVNLKLWPDLPAGVPRRVSVNSFGFGGTNAHAIIESWEPENDPIIANFEEEVLASRGADLVYCPFVLSAKTESALRGAVIALAKALRSSDSIDLGDLAWTLHCRRTEFDFKAAFAANDKNQLVERLEDGTALSSLSTRPIQVSQNYPARFLGVFTGQGAQWPSMGACLFRHSQSFRKSILQLEESLKHIPDPPSWSLSEELIASADVSRIHSAEIAQPLSTALQVGLVDLLRSSGVLFSAVVGHSSGEIAAAYAAGYLTASDAIKVAYYRGFHLHSSLFANKRDGKMMAVAMSFAEAESFCARGQFSGRIRIAANNSKSSVTLSGDADAIDEAKGVLDELRKFARVLQVDVAYHSHHMEALSPSYLASLRACEIQSQRIGSELIDCKWYSSVHGLNGRSIASYAALSDTYWVDNMVKPVLFSQAIERAVEEEYCIDIILEVGPHPTLKGPVTDTLKILTGLDIPYYGVLKRNEDDMVAFLDALGFIWKNISPASSCLDLERFRKACEGQVSRNVRVQKDLPGYSWNHDTPLLKESRKSKLFRTREHPAHELLGTPSITGERQKMHWQNLFKLSEMEWLRGHKFQGQVVFPAAGFVSMAIEASINMVRDGQMVSLVELQDLNIHRAITLKEESSGTEVIFDIRRIDQGPKRIMAEYSCYSVDADSSPSDIEQLNFTGRALITFGGPDDNVLPYRAAPNLPLTKISLERFYHWMSKTGLDYSNDFQVDSMKRRLNFSTVTMTRFRNCELRIHPATLDAAFHSLFAAFSFPGDDRLWTSYLPTGFQNIRVPISSLPQEHHDSSLLADCYLREASAKVIRGDLEVFNADSFLPEIQIQGLVLSSFAKPSEDDDRKLFFRNVWRRDIFYGIEERVLSEKTKDLDEIYDVCERAAYFFMRKLCEQISRDEILLLSWHFQCYFQWALDYLLPAVKTGQHPRVQAHWIDDKLEEIMYWKAKYPNQIDLQLIHQLGPNLLNIVRGLSSPLQLLRENNLLNRMYAEGLGAPQANLYLGQLAGQLSHRYPKLRILEVGAGTGGATGAVLRHLYSFESYTFTDISPGFFENAQEIFCEHESRMVYKTLDIERCPIEQDFEEQSFDLLIASNVLHATSHLSTAIQNCRKLVRPGGRIMLLEVTSETLRVQYIFGTLPGWWLGRDDGRVNHPTVTEAQWNTILRESGFSGVDYSCRDFDDSSKYTFSVMTSQAIDNRVEALREPLLMPSDAIQLENLLIVGGQTLTVASIALKVQRLMRPFTITTTVISKLEDISTKTLTPGSAIICISDLDEPAFNQINTQKFGAIQTIFENSKHILWVTRGCRSNDPYANIIVGAGRSVMLESPHVNIQFVDIDSVQKNCPAPAMFSEMMLRMVCLELPDYQDLLWSKESELVIESGSLYIPRILPDRSLNDHLNSERRIVQRDVMPSSTPVALINRDDSLTLEVLTGNPDIKDTDQVRVRVETSSIFSFSTTDNPPVHLCIGRLSDSAQRVLTLANTNCSLIDVPSDRIFRLKGDAAKENILAYVMAELLSESLVAGVSGTLWIHDADPLLSEVASAVAARRDVRLLLTTTSAAAAGECRYIHPHTTERELESIIPSSLDRFASIDISKVPSLASLIKARLDGEDIIRLSDQRHRRKERFNHRLSFSSSALNLLLKKLCSSVGSYQMPNHAFSEVVRVNEFAQHLGHLSLLSILDWRGAETLQLMINPTSAHGLFSGNKTYFLVGLTGEVGISLCEWMINHGAKYFALSSRSPNINPRIIEHLERKGGRIETFPFDIADKEALHRVHHEITTSMPPIGGVANAAMVLNDKPFSNMSSDEFQSALKPKVNGTKHLDELFYSDDLEFFILFSSISSIIGNPAQSNYAAANTFMSSLAAQRRKRGKPASIIHIAMLLGFGYFTTQGEWLENHMRQMDFMPISEPEFHTIFAEAVITGRPDSGLDPELITGLGNNPDAPWRRFARFSHLGPQQMDSVQRENQEGSTQSMQSRLAEAGGTREARATLEMLFSEKLGRVLQIPAERIQKNKPIISLGIDSLIAVEIRSWFFKELAVDIPILALLGGASVEDICQDAVAKLLDLMKKSLGSNAPDPNSAEPIPPTSVSSPVLTPTFDAETPFTPGAMSIFSPSMEPSTAASTDEGEAMSNASEPEFALEPRHERVAEMSQAQARLYFLHEYLEDKSTFTIAYIGKLHGHLNLPRVRNAVQAVGKRHESLRSSYYVEEVTHRAMQAVNPEAQIEVDHLQILNEDEVAKEVDALRSFVFEIECGRLMRVIILTQSPSLHHIIFLHHHIALDGLSWPLFLRDFKLAYSGQMPTVNVQQAIEMSEKQLEAYQPEKLNNELAFWRELHKDPQEPLPLFPFAKVKTRQVLKVYDNETFVVKLDSSVSQGVRDLAAKLQVTSFHFYLSALSMFLSRCLNVEDLGIGIVDANRSAADNYDTIGYFLNMLPLRFRLAEDESFCDIARRSRDMVLAALANSQAPFDMVLDNIEDSRSGNHHSLFQVVMNYRMGYSTQTSLGDGKIEWTDAIYARNPYDMVVDVTESSEYTLLSFTTQKYLYSSSDSRLLVKWYTRALEGLLQDPLTSVSKCPVANEDDLRQASELGLGKSMTVNWDGTLIHRIEKMAEQYPDSTAVKDGYGRTLKYTDLISRYCEIGSCLRNSLATPGSRVATVLDPAADAICCILAIWRIGNVWVPLDIRNHDERLSVMISECQPAVILCDKLTQVRAESLAAGNVRVINLSDLFQTRSTSTKNISRPDEVAVIFYTSGSTGKPKGVVMTHDNITNQIYGNTALFGIGREIVLQQSSFGFDLVLEQVFHALANGGTLIVVGNEDRGNPTHLAELMLSESVTYTNFVPSEYLALLHYGLPSLQQCRSWRFAFTAGEKVESQLRRGFQKLNMRNLQLLNAYGPIESTMACARGIIPYQAEDDITAQGDSLWPSPNYYITVMDEHMSHVPIGFPGEICVSGAGITLGYLNSPDETRSKFIDVCGTSDPTNPYTKLYRTGDRGRILEDGSINILGRLDGDSQVKIRGIRIELDEISNTLIRESDTVISNAAVSFRRDTEILAAFVVFDPKYGGDKDDFAAQLKARLTLPPYMCPAFIIPTACIPTNANGKKDRAAINRLPIPDDQEPDVFSSDLTDMQLRVREVWREVLVNRPMRLSKVNADTDFFHVGGNSMLLIKLRSVIHSTFGTTLTLPELFRSCTLRSMASRIEASHDISGTAVIDWNAEIAAMTHGLPRLSANTYSTATASSSLIVVLTGATGFLGTHILQRLIIESRVKEVHCIAIRPDSLGIARHVSVQSSKIVEYVGDLSDRLLGLTASQFSFLSDNAHLVIHNGAEVSFLKTYRSLRPANVASTKTLCELALPRRIPVHFVSTASVAKFAGESTLDEVSVRLHPPPYDTSDGYNASKWASEALLEQIAMDIGMPAWIHRPTSIVGEGAPELDLVSLIFAYSRQLGAVPIIEAASLESGFDFVPVEKVAEGLVEAALLSLNPAEPQQQQQRTTTSFVHHCSNERVAVDDLKHYMEEKEGTSFEALQMDHWLELALGEGLHPLVHDYLKSMVAGKKVVLSGIAKRK